MPGIHKVFPTRLLQPITRPLDRQVIREPHPVGLQVGKEVEYSIEEIMDQKKGQGYSDLYLTKWTGYQMPTWESKGFMKDLVALDLWEAKKKDSHVPLGGQMGMRQKKRRRGIM